MTTPPLRAGLPLEVDRLTKRFGPVLAVDDLSFGVVPGRVTGFLGPNGAGKTTTLRLLLGLLRPTSGRATVGGRPYADLPHPLTVVGAALEASGFHPGRTAREHLRVVAQEAGLPLGRADRLLGQVGLGDAAGRRVGGFSTGMRQRLALATALLGDPGVLVLDEPANGLDPEGIAWLRQYLRFLAASGCTVLVSSHVLSEVAQTVDDVVIIAHGRLVRAGPMRDVVAGHDPYVEVRAADPDRLAAALSAAGARVTALGAGALEVRGLAAAAIGDTALAAGVSLHQLVDRHDDLEDVFLSLTESAPAQGAS